jgi:hypothetical protein
MIELKEPITVIVLHQNHHRRAEQLIYALRSLDNIKGAELKPVIVGDKVDGLSIDNVVTKQEHPALAIAEACKKLKSTTQDLIIMSDDMCIVNKCMVSTILVPKYNAVEENRPTHTPFYARKEIFMADDFKEMLNATQVTEIIVRRALKIPSHFCVPVDFSQAPFLANFVSDSPNIKNVRDRLSNRYFFHISDASFPAIEPIYAELFPTPCEYESKKADNPDLEKPQPTPGENIEPNAKGGN